ncbi:MAG: hypothetical protein IJJ33_08445 [Victivallales bacterium]|nr:hypothetical protein [Victivallales bacterium]
MNLKKTLLTLMICGLIAPSFARQSEKQFFLVDQRTQMPVLSYPVQPNWLTGGKTNWTAEPATPVNWYVWSMSPDQRVKIIFSSLAVIPAAGQIRQVPFLQDPTILANQFLQVIPKDHNLANVRLVEAHFNHREPERGLIDSRLQMARQHGIRPTNFYYTELSIHYEGLRDGQRYTVVFSVPMLATENRPGMGFATVVELLTPMSFSCPPELERSTRQSLENTMKKVQMNPHFTAVVNRIAAQRTANWLRVQNEIRNQQLEAAANTSSTLDRVRDRWSEYIRDVDTVSNPNTGEKMFVDTRYDHAWINSDNEVIYHNSGFNTPNASTATFDPNSNALFNSTNWSKLK